MKSIKELPMNGCSNGVEVKTPSRLELGRSFTLGKTYFRLVCWTKAMIDTISKPIVAKVLTAS